MAFKPFKNLQLIYSLFNQKIIIAQKKKQNVIEMIFLTC